MCTKEYSVGGKHHLRITDEAIEKAKDACANS